MTRLSRAGNDDVYDLVIDVAAGQPTVDTIAERLRRLATGHPHEVTCPMAGGVSAHPGSASITQTSDADWGLHSTRCIGELPVTR